MNHPFILEQSRHAARRLLSETALGPDDHRIERAYRLVLGRPPSGRERQIANEFRTRSEDVGDGASASPEDAWALLFQALFATIDFRYID